MSRNVSSKLFPLYLSSIDCGNRPRRRWWPWRVSMSSYMEMATHSGIHLRHLQSIDWCGCLIIWINSELKICCYDNNAIKWEIRLFPFQFTNINLLRRMDVCWWKSLGLCFGEGIGRTYHHHQYGSGHRSKVIILHLLAVIIIIIIGNFWLARPSPSITSVYILTLNKVFPPKPAVESSFTQTTTSTNHSEYMNEWTPQYVAFYGHSSQLLLLLLSFAKLLLNPVTDWLTGVVPTVEAAWFDHRLNLSKFQTIKYTDTSYTPISLLFRGD